MLIDKLFSQDSQWMWGLADGDYHMPTAHWVNIQVVGLVWIGVKQVALFWKVLSFLSYWTMSFLAHVWSDVQSQCW